MKFNQSQKQNQRIERTSTSLVVGIDMAKETHCCTSNELSWNRTYNSSPLV